MASNPKYMQALETESSRFRERLTSIDPASPVPSCPDWTAADLLWHLGEVQQFWARIVEGRLASPDELEEPERPSGYDGLLAFFAQASRRLQTALAVASDDESVWTWANDQSVGFIRRRQAHEALIHRIDAELTSGTDILDADPDLARDGVDEVLTVILAELPEWATFTPGDSTVSIETTDFPESWTLQFGRFRGTSTNTGKSYDEATACLVAERRVADCVIAGEAWPVDRWLWGRSGAEHLTITGDQSLSHRLRELIVESTQ